MRSAQVRSIRRSSTSRRRPRKGPTRPAPSSPRPSRSGGSAARRRSRQPPYRLDCLDQRLPIRLGLQCQQGRGAVVRAQLDRRSQGARNPHQSAEPGHVETPDLSGLMSEKAESGAVALVPLGGSGCQTIWAKPRCSSLPTRALTSPASNSSSMAVWRRFEERGFSGAGSSHRQSGEAKR